MERWWEASAPSLDGEEETSTSFVVVEAKLHNPSAWKRAVMDRITVLVGDAMRELLALVQHGLSVAVEADDETKVAAADFTLAVTTEGAARIAKLLAQKKFDKDGKPYPFSNAYRFIAIAQTDAGWVATARLALGFWNERMRAGGATIKTHALSIIPATTGFQQLLQTYALSSALQLVPRELRAGVCQEVAQQVTSYLGQLESSRVREGTAFPTVEDRDPVRRRAVYVMALKALLNDVRPFNRVSKRELFPGEYAADDAAGDKLVVADERYRAITRSPDPHPIPLLFVKGDAVVMVAGTARFDAGIAKRDRHRGNQNERSFVRASRPAKVQKAGSTGMEQWYAVLPLFDSNATRAIAAQRNQNSSGRGLDLHFQAVPLCGGETFKVKPNHMLVPISADRARFGTIVRRRDLSIAWSRLVRKHDGAWYVQLTLRVATPSVAATERVLGVSFGLDAVANWVLMDRAGHVVERGTMAPNEQWQVYRERKEGVEQAQRAGKWVGGQRFARELEIITHRLVNHLIELARSRNARLAVEDITYAEKSSPDAAANVRFTAWNYGQLRRMLAYKAPLYALGQVWFVNDFITAFTCPACQAIRKPKQPADRATTWRDNGTVHCRKCGVSTLLTDAHRAETVARALLAKLAS